MSCNLTEDVVCLGESAVKTSIYNILTASFSLFLYRTVSGADQHMR